MNRPERLSKEAPLERRPDNPGQERSAEDRHSFKARNVLLATAGHLLVLVILLAMDGLGISDMRFRTWMRVTGLMVVVQGVLWITARRGWDEQFGWDPDFLYLPMLATVGLFTVYIYLAPAGRGLLLMGWFVALLFAVGRLGLKEVVSLASVMTLLYVGAVWHLSLQGEDISMPFDLLRGGVFLAVNLYGGLVLEQLRSKRRETQALRRELAEMAVTDSLTGLPNRRYMEEFLKAELARIRRYGGECALMMVDVDDFKHYNDTLGHLAGDEVLRMLAETMQEQMRVSDITARFGGEEFGVIMVNTGPDEAREAAERLRHRIERKPFPHEEIQPGEELTVSAGFACCPEHGQAYEELVEAADRAMYRAKAEGKNCVRSA